MKNSLLALCAGLVLAAIPQASFAESMTCPFVVYGADAAEGLTELQSTWLKTETNADGSALEGEVQLGEYTVFTHFLRDEYLDLYDAYFGLMDTKSQKRLGLFTVLLKYDGVYKDGSPDAPAGAESFVFLSGSVVSPTPARFVMLEDAYQKLKPLGWTKGVFDMAGPDLTDLVTDAIAKGILVQGEPIVAGTAFGCYRAK